MAKEKTTKRSGTVKAENPNVRHKDAFKIVAQRWKDSTENPKNQVQAK
ncbi:9962_t:CDS:2 [Diversispora eburnea]|uniref:9962_t:CDS:1 n=1 Tax=Diversispora eburnea TaxID=1213867 RepID=A0A9N8WL94_9GLOM|nr:9962_t:CDS:2 [Diversispora eburnea]